MLQYNPQQGYLTVEQVARMQAEKIEMLERELHGLREMNQRYMNDIIKAMNESTRLRNELHKYVQMVHGKYASWQDPEDSAR